MTLVQRLMSVKVSSLLPLVVVVGLLVVTIPRASSPSAALTALLALVVVAAIGQPWLRAATAQPLPAGNASTGRDLSVDFLRGLAMLFVVVDHVELPSLYGLVSYERVGVLTGAELFVVLSGTVLGLGLRRRAQASRSGEAQRVLRRAGTLYIVAILVALSGYLVSQVPGADHTAITAWTEDGTVFPAYSDLGSPLTFLLDIALLNSVAWPFNIMGLYVLLLLLTPLVLPLLWRGRVAWLLAGSWLVYGLYTLYPMPLLAAEFTTSFPPLAWQLLFVHGLALGYHRQEVNTWLHTRVGHALLIAAGVVCLSLAFYSWNNPNKTLLELSVIPPEVYQALYARFFERGSLGLGRLLNVAAFVIVAMTLLNRYWPLFQRTMGWLLVPLGQATLYVYILQVGVVLLVASLPLPQRHPVIVSTVLHTFILLALWAMIRRQLFFRWIPR